MKRARGLVALAFAALAGAALAQSEVSIPSADLSHGPGLMLKGFWFQATSTERAPAVVLLHGCSGAYDKRGVLSQRMRDYAALLNRAGMHALVLDSLTPRGETQNCTQKVRSRLITQAHRRIDALSALEWLAARDDVDPARLGLLGWSNGGSTVLAATNERHTDAVSGDDVRPAFAIAFYPGCDADLKRGYEPAVPLLMLVGEADDWTPAKPCLALARSAGEPRPQIVAYPGAFHGFDSDAPLRLRKDVPNGVHPGQGVHVGGNPAAWRDSRDRVVRFVADH